MRNMRANPSSSLLRVGRMSASHAGQATGQVGNGDREGWNVGEGAHGTALHELEAALGHGFARPELLVCALTHRSLAHELAQARRQCGTGAETSDGRATTSGWSFWATRCWAWWWPRRCFALHPEWHEGELTRVRVRLVSRQHMAQVAAAIGLGKHLRLSRGEDRSGLRRKSTVLSNTMEAVMGALFLDGGLEPVRAFVAPPGDGRSRRAIGSRSCAPAPRWATTSRRCRSSCRRRAPALRSTASRARAAPTTASAFWWRCALKGASRRARKAAGPRHGQHQEARRAGRRAPRTGAAGSRTQRRRFRRDELDDRRGANAEEPLGAMSASSPAPTGVHASTDPAHQRRWRARCARICPLCRRRWLRCCAPWWWRCLCSPLCCSPSSFPPKAWSTRCWWAIFCCSTSRSMRRPAVHRPLAPALSRGGARRHRRLPPSRSALAGQARGGHSRRPAAHRGRPGDRERRRPQRALRGL